MITINPFSPRHSVGGKIDGGRVARDRIGSIECCVYYVIIIVALNALAIAKGKYVQMHCITCGAFDDTNDLKQPKKKTKNKTKQSIRTAAEWVRKKRSLCTRQRRCQDNLDSAIYIYIFRF